MPMSFHKRAAAAARRFGRNEAGGFAMLAAIFLPLAVLIAALSIDLAMLTLEKRKARAAVDLAAIIAAQNLHASEKAARSVLSVNGHDTVTEVELGRMAAKEREEAKVRPVVRVERGRYIRDLMKARRERFVAGGAPYNAARVTLQKTGRYHFAGAFFEPPVYEVSAIASAQEIAAFSVGSRLARLDGGVANALLSALTGSTVSLSLLDYEALLKADIDLFSFFDSLAADLSITSGRYSDVLAAEPTLGEVMTALARVSESEGSGAAARALTRLAAAATADLRKTDLTSVVDLGPFAGLAIGGAGAQGMPVKARAMDMLLASAAVANGETLIDLNLTANAPGLAAVTARLLIGETMQNSPWLRAGLDGDVVSNAQIRLQIVAELLGSGALKAASVRVPLYLEVAQAEARLSEIRCPGGRASAAEVDILGRPGVAELWLGEVEMRPRAAGTPSVARARLVSAAGVTAFGRARARIGNIDEAKLTFRYADVEAGAIKSTATTDYLESLLASLADDLELDVTVLGLGLGGQALVLPALRSTLGGALGALDDVVASLLETLGITVGEADIRVNGVRCDRSVLVQ